jgi:hypothetical protein
MGDGITLRKIEENEEELVYASYDEYFDRDTGERTCISGTFSLDKYRDGIKELEKKGECIIKGYGGIELCISKISEENQILVLLQSGWEGVQQNMHFKKLDL